MLGLTWVMTLHLGEINFNLSICSNTILNIHLHCELWEIEIEGPKNLIWLVLLE